MRTAAHDRARIAVHHGDLDRALKALKFSAAQRGQPKEWFVGPAETRRYKDRQGEQKTDSARQARK